MAETQATVPKLEDNELIATIKGDTYHVVAVMQSDLNQFATVAIIASWRPQYEDLHVVKPKGAVPTPAADLASHKNVLKHKKGSHSIVLVAEADMGLVETVGLLEHWGPNAEHVHIVRPRSTPPAQ